MQLSHPVSSLDLLAATREEDRHRDEERRHARHRGQLDTRSLGPSPYERLRLLVHGLGQRDHSLTPYQCRLPDGRIGRVAVVQAGGEWTLVCRLA